MQSAPNLADFSVSTNWIGRLCDVANLGIAGSRLTFTAVAGPIAKPRP